MDRGLDNLAAVLRGEGLPTEIAEIEVKDELTARALKFFGSPSIRVNGLDIDARLRDIGESAFACRCYPGGLPPEEMIRMALKEAREP